MRRAAAEFHRAAGDPIRFEHLKADGGPNNVDNGIHGADFVKSDFIRRKTVYLRFRPGNQAENMLRPFLRAIADTGSFYQGANLFPGGVMMLMMFMAVFMLMAVFMVMAMAPHFRMGTADTATLFPAEFQFPPGKAEFLQLTPQLIRITAQINHGPQSHVAGNSGKAVKMQGSQKIFSLYGEPVAKVGYCEPSV
jgi:hypothetical protein